MTFRSGDIVLVPFPFTDLSASKRRPALLLRSLGEFGDWLCLPVTTRGGHLSSHSIATQNLRDGGLPHASWVRCDRPTLLSESIMLGRIATLAPAALENIRMDMCKALDCSGFAVNEVAAVPYSPGSEG